MLNPPLPERVKKLVIDEKGVHWSPKLTLPYEPFIGTIGTLVTAGGAFLMTYLQKPKEGDAKQATPQSININIPAQQQAAGGKTVIIKEKAAGGAQPVAQPKPKKKEGDEFKEEAPKW